MAALCAIYGSSADACVILINYTDAFEGNKVAFILFDYVPFLS